MCRGGFGGCGKRDSANETVAPPVPERSAPVTALEPIESADSVQLQSIRSKDSVGAGPAAEPAP